MKMTVFTPLALVLFLFCLSCSPRYLVIVQQPPAQEKQVDVVTRNGKTVDVREAARNLHNRKMYLEAWEILRDTNNARLSSATVNLLKTVLDDHFSDSMATDDFTNIRVRAVALLGLSRNPKAMAIVTNRMFNDSHYRVRACAARSLGRLAGEEALPALLVALEKRKIGKLNAGFFYVGDEAAPLIIQWMEEDFAENGGQNHAVSHITRLFMTGDRRAIEPLLRIVAYPASPSDPTIDWVRFEAATALARFTSEAWYEYPLEKWSAHLAFNPVTQRENRKVNANDRKRIIKALQNAGYDPDWLVFPVLISGPDGNAE